VLFERRGERDGSARLLRRSAESFVKLSDSREVKIEYAVARLQQRVARAFGRNVWVAVAVAAYPRAEAHDARQFARAQVRSVDIAEGVGHLLVDFRESSYEAGRVVVQAHLDLVAHGRRSASNLVGLPERRYLRRDSFGGLLRAAVRERQPVETFKLGGDARALEADWAARDLRRVRREDRHDLDAAQKFERVV